MAEVELSTDHDDGGDEPATVDGRRLRRERNVAAVIDAVLEMFEDESLTPTIERAAERSGLSLRSVYRYFPDPESLTQAAIEEMRRRGEAVMHLSAIGTGPFEPRVIEFAEMRVRLYEHVGPGFRAGRLYAPRSVRIREDMERTRRGLTDQFDLQFRTELDALPARTLGGAAHDRRRHEPTRGDRPAPPDAAPHRAGDDRRRRRRHPDGAPRMRGTASTSTEGGPCTSSTD